ncbi:MAG: Tol biopolymer transport system component [Halieaceae bacterium]|jgi:Tol biopolymer transport system component
MGKLFEELKRRKVFRVAMVYAVVAWLLIQVTDVVLPTFGAPDWVGQTIIFLFILGFPVAVVLSWAYEVTPDGILADSPNQASHVAAPPGDQKLIYAIFALVLLVVGFQIAQRSTVNQLLSENTSGMGEEAMLETRVDIVTQAAASTAYFSLSPDGRQIVFVASGERGESHLWLRPLNRSTAQLLDGTEGASTPFWSPDGRTIGFLTDNALKRLDLGGGDPQTLAPIDFPRGGSWGADNTLLFSANPSGPLVSMSASGGEATAATTLESGQINHRSPFFLPDGRRFLFYAQGSPDTAGIYLGHLDGTASVRLTPADSAGVFHPDGWLLWVGAGTLTAQKLDLEQSALIGEPLTLAEGVANNRAQNTSALSVSTTGLIAYRRGLVSAHQLTWIDRSGEVSGTLGEPDVTMYAPRHSPSDSRVAVYRSVQGNIDVWLMDDVRTSRFTFDEALDVFALWSPDGSQIVFNSTRTGGGDLYLKSSRGTGLESLIVGSDLPLYPSSWSADGRFLMYMISSQETSTDFWAVPMTGEPVPFIVLQTPFDERWGTFSPDGRWVAYHSNESGRNEVYIREFVGPDASATEREGGLWQVSTAGGTFAVWSPDGQELYYLDPAGDLLAASFMANGDTVGVSAPELVFSSGIYGGGTDSGLGRQYDVAPDGRFLINAVVGEGATNPITLIQNWNPEAAQ